MMYDEPGGMWNEVVMAYFKVLFGMYLERLGEKHENLS
jgi:hypothetical protein